MAYRITLTVSAAAIVADLSPPQLEQFDDIVDFLAFLPRPIRGSSLVRAGYLYGRPVLIYAEERFLFRIYYTVEPPPSDLSPDIEGLIRIVVLVRR